MVPRNGPSVDINGDMHLARSEGPSIGVDNPTASNAPLVPPSLLSEVLALSGSRDVSGHVYERYQPKFSSFASVMLCCLDEEIASLQNRLLAR